MHKIYIVEDHPLMRETYRVLVDGEPDLNVCGIAPTATEALQRIRESTPDLVLVDLSLPDMNGYVLIKQLHQEFPDLPALVVSGHPASQYEAFAKRGGAVGYVDKLEAHQTLIPAIRHVLGRAT
jgi:DNA-binding NarL/FixJ family response regulator